jgi:hypothetical protein
MVDKTEKDALVVDDTTIEDDDTPPEPDIFDAVSDAIDEQTVGLDTSADGDAPTGDDDVVTPTEETPDADKETPPDDGGDDTPKPDESPDGEGDTPKPDGDKEDLPGGDKPADADGATPKDPAPKDAGPDHVNDPIPKELAEKTQERIRSLADRTKVAEAAVTERTTELDEMITMVTETGTSGEQYGQVLGFMKLFNSDNEVDQRAAYKVMQTELATMAAKLGEPLVGEDPLAAHSDLQAEVEAGTLTGDRAIEIATIRGREKANALRTETGNADAAAQNDIEQAIVDAKGELAVYEQAKAKDDPQWLEKKAILVPALRSVMRTVHPSLWKSTFEEAYDKLVVVKKPAVLPKPKVPTPLRPKAPAGEGAKEPTTMAEAIELSLGGSIDD